MRIDQSMHSLFARLKWLPMCLCRNSADILASRQRALRWLPDRFRSRRHRTARFLSHLMKCTVSDIPYTILWLSRIKQVRATTFTAATPSTLLSFFPKPACRRSIIHIGGSRFAGTAHFEAIDLCQQIVGRPRNGSIKTQTASVITSGISDVRKFQRHYPDWQLRHTVTDILEEIYGKRRTLAPREDVMNGETDHPRIARHNGYGNGLCRRQNGRDHSHTGHS